VEILGADGGAITLAYTGSERVTLCATDAVAARLEDLQDVLGEGPGPEAYRFGEAVTVHLGDGGVEPWLMFAEAACEALGPAVTVYAIPIRLEAGVLGVLTLYQAHERRLAHGLSDAQFLADALGAVLLRDPGSQTEMASGPWASRAVVHRATGIVVAQLGLGPEDALAVLRGHAYAHDVTVEAVAAAVVERRLDLGAADREEDP